LTKWRLGRRRAGYHSRFGGLWTDRIDAATRLEAKQRTGGLSESDAELIRSWRKDGFLILTAAVSHDVIDTINESIESAWRSRDSRILLDIAGECHALAPEHRQGRCKILDFYAFCPQVLQAMFAPRIRSFLRQVFECEPLAFQSLNFEHGT